jgi:hypothetical protein
MSVPHALLSARLTFVFALCAAFVDGSAAAGERVRFEQEGVLLAVDGEVLVEASDGGVLLEGRDGRIWTIPPEEIVKRESSAEPILPYDEKQLTAEIMRQLPDGFQVHRTVHYLVFFNTSRAYAQWCGSLYERLYRAYYNFWRRRGIKLQPPATPLVAVVFDDAGQYRAFSQAELGSTPSSVIGYYSLRTNWITTFDLTGLEGVRQPGGRPKTSVVVNQILSQPAAAPNVATLIHEATHQLAFNSGLQTRYADNPLWVSEGLAVYFEVPDLTSTKGWKRIGSVHPQRLARFEQTQAGRSSGWLRALVTGDERFRKSETAVTSYAESWVLCHFLIHRRQQQLASYLQALAEQPRLIFGTRQDRFEKFVEHFGELGQLEEKVLAYAKTLR